MADVIVDQNSFVTAAGDYPIDDLTNQQRVCQIFTASASYTLTKIGIKGRESGSCPGNAQVWIYDAGADEPTGAVLDTATVVASTFPATRNWRYFTMAGAASIVSGQKYAIVVAALAAQPAGTGYLEISYTVDKVVGGLLTTTDLGENWDTTLFAANDLNFRAYKTEAEAPTKATNPSPANSATGVDWSAKGLSWDDGGGADTYDVYFGLTGALELISSAQVGTSITVDDSDITYPEEGESGAIYYWRIDSTNGEGTTTGDEWNFDARPAKASVPSPADSATDAVLGLTTTWTGGATASTYNTLADVGEGLVSQSTDLDSATWTPSPTIFDYITEYTWRVDSVNIYGITEGDEWTFTTIRFSAPTVTYFYPTTGQYYQLLIQADGSYGDVPGVGIENTDYVFLAAGYEPNFIKTTRKLVAASMNTIYYEDI